MQLFVMLTSSVDYNTKYILSPPLALWWKHQSSYSLCLAWPGFWDYLQWIETHLCLHGSSPSSTHYRYKLPCNVWKLTL